MNRFTPNNLFWTQIYLYFTHLVAADLTLQSISYVCEIQIAKNLGQNKKAWNLGRKYIYLQNLKVARRRRKVIFYE